MLRAKTTDVKILKTYQGRTLKSCAENHHIPSKRKNKERALRKAQNKVTVRLREPLSDH